MLEYIAQYKKQYGEDFELLYKILHENKYDEFFPGISDPANYAKYKEIYKTAFNYGMTRFVQKEFGLSQGYFVPWIECHNHRPYDDTMYRALDSKRNVLRQHKETLTLEPWGCPDFEYFYSRKVKDQAERRRKHLNLPEEVLNRLDEESLGNVTQFDSKEPEGEKEPEIYQILT